MALTDKGLKTLLKGLGAFPTDFLVDVVGIASFVIGSRDFPNKKSGAEAALAFLDEFTASGHAAIDKDGICAGCQDYDDCHNIEGAGVPAKDYDQKLAHDKLDEFCDVIRDLGNIFAPDSLSDNDKFIFSICLAKSLLDEADTVV